VLTVAGMTALALAAGAPAGFPAHATAPGGSDLVEVIVRYDDGAGPEVAERAVVRAGGTVGDRLDIVDGLTAELPAGSVRAVRATAGIAAVTVDAPVRLSADQWRADEDLNSLHSITKAAGIQDTWTRSDASGRKIIGTGIGVALIDSGIAPVKGLTVSGKVVNGPDLSFESQSPELRHLDTFGHGTHMAGIIAGNDPETAGTNLNDSRHFVGVAPGAHLVNVKVAAADGATDVSQVIAAIDWVVQHRNDPGLNVRVLNLSFGTDSLQDPRLDPLSFAVEAAWRKGIVVVVAAGNDGPQRTTLAMPAVNPYVVAVGAVDPNGTVDRRDDVVADFSTQGDAVRHADVLAPGYSVVSLRVPGSFVDTRYPAALVAGEAEQRFFRGSGTSQAAAVVSGAAALLLQQRPLLNPDQVKRLLMTTTEALPATSGDVFGTGQLDLKRAAETAAPAIQQSHRPALGTGSLEQSRGSAHVADPDTGVELTGERDIFGAAWDPATWTVAAATGKAWDGGTWNGTEWTGSDWSGDSWAARTWSARTWSAQTWSGSTWSARTWSDAYWTGDAWSARTWSARTWSARTWSGGYWSAGQWR
jgi:serine protease AprX